jgi:hypothetical protein
METAVPADIIPVQEVQIDNRPRTQFVPFHERAERFACIVTHRRAGRTVACVRDLQLEGGIDAA